jgi:hypothetical protein
MRSRRKASGRIPSVRNQDKAGRPVAGHAIAGLRDRNRRNGSNHKHDDNNNNNNNNHDKSNGNDRDNGNPLAPEQEGRGTFVLRPSEVLPNLLIRCALDYGTRKESGNRVLLTLLTTQSCMTPTSV